MSLLKALRQLESGYRQSGNLELAKLKLDESRRQFDEMQEFREDKLAFEQGLQEELSQQKIDAFKLDRFTQALDIMQGASNQQLSDVTTNLLMDLNRFDPIKKLNEGKIESDRALKDLVKNNKFSEKDARAVIDLKNLFDTMQTAPEFKRAFLNKGLELSQSLTQQIMTGAKEDGIAKAFYKKGIMPTSETVPNAAEQNLRKYSESLRIQKTLNRLLQERKDALLKKDYEIQSEIDSKELDEVAELLMGG